jgi:murein DD-endopeptidase MepM/ murein hydrolase activator NlpD
MEARMDLRFRFQRNEEAQLQKLFAKHHRRQNRKHIAEEKIEIKKAQKEAAFSTMNYRRTGRLQLPTSALAKVEKRPIARIAHKAHYGIQKRVFSVQSVFLYIYYSALDALDSAKSRKAAYIACAFLMALSAAAAAGVDYAFGYEIILNGYNIGYVRDLATFNGALEAADAQFREWYQNDSVFYERTITKISAFIGNKEDILLDREACERKIMECNIPIFAQGGVITVNGEEAIRLASVSEAEYMRENLASKMTPSKNVISEQVVSSIPQQSIAVVPRTVEMTSVKSVDDAIDYLLSPQSPSSKAADAASAASEDPLINKIVETNDSGNKGLMTSLNFREEEFAVGDLATKPKVTFNTVKLVKYQEPIKYSKEYKNDSSLLEGTTKVLQEGKNGAKEIEAVITYANNKETSREISSETVISEPVNQIIARGTREITVVSDGTGSGDYIIPVSGRISSFTSQRSGSHSTYRAIDIACPTGTNVAAAKKGTVTKAEYYGDYGKCVIVKHADGYSTLYAHLSSFKVSVGDTVKQGETIALSGNTGRTTGPHLHFEIRKNDSRLDLRNFFSVKEGQKIKAGLKSK